MRRRTFLAFPVLLAAPRALAEMDYPPVRAGVALAFPRDHGSHPAFRTEWWYITGSVRSKAGAEVGLQLTFFRSRPGIGEANPSRFAPKQLLFAHAAVSDPGIGRLLLDQRAAREGFGLAAAAEQDTDVRVEDWRLRRTGDAYEARIAGREFEFSLRFRPTQPVLLQGERGFSRKGPEARQASYYYSRPQLEVSGSMTIKGRSVEVTGAAWPDHQ